MADLVVSSTVHPTWRSLLLDRVEYELRTRFGGAIMIQRRSDDDGEMSLAATWNSGGGAFVRLPANSAMNLISANDAIEVLTARLWDCAPIIGSC